MVFMNLTINLFFEREHSISYQRENLNKFAFSVIQSYGKDGEVEREGKKERRIGK